MYSKSCIKRKFSMTFLHFPATDEPNGDRMSPNSQRILAPRRGPKADRAPWRTMGSDSPFVGLNRHTSELTLKNGARTAVSERSLTPRFFRSLTPNGGIRTGWKRLGLPATRDGRG